MTAVERYEPTGDPLVDRALRHWGQGSLLPRQYRIDQKDNGAPDWPNLTIAATCLRTLDVDPFPNLPDTYVVGGRLGMMHGLQVALAQREGVDITEVYSDEETATVNIRRPGERDGHDVTVTMGEATKAGWTQRNPCYRTMPRRMLLARATTHAIDRYAPGVLRGIASTVQPIAALDGAQESGGVGQGPHNPPPSTAPAGYDRPPSDDLRARVTDALRRLQAVDPAAAADLRDEGAALRRGGQIPDRVVYAYILDEAEGALKVSGGAAAAPTDDDGAAPPPAGGGVEPDARQYADDDPARPF